MITNNDKLGLATSNAGENEEMPTMLSRLFRLLARNMDIIIIMHVTFRR
jgi:hypothetical protein